MRRIDRQPDAIEDIGQSFCYLVIENFRKRSLDQSKLVVQACLDYRT